MQFDHIITHCILIGNGNLKRRVDLLEMTIDNQTTPPFICNGDWPRNRLFIQNLKFLPNYYESWSK